MLPFNRWFCIFFLQILKAVVYQMAMVVLDTHPADQFGLSEACYVPSNHFSIHCDAPLFVGLQVNQPYFFVITVRSHNLLRTDHFDRNIPAMVNFHFLPEQYLSVFVSVKKKYPTLSNVLNVLHSSLLLSQKHECVVEGSEHRANICVLLFEADGNRFFVKHQWLSINGESRQWTLITIGTPLSKTNEIRNHRKNTHSPTEV